MPQVHGAPVQRAYMLLSRSDWDKGYMGQAMRGESRRRKSAP